MLIGLVFFSAISSGFAVFYFMFYALLAVLLASFAWTRLNLFGLSINASRRSGLSQVGDYVETKLFIKNENILPKILLEVRDMEDLPGVSTGSLLNIKPLQEVTWSGKALLRKRGVYKLGPPKAYTSDLFDLFHFTKTFAGVNEITVHPATVHIPNFQLSYSAGVHPGTSRRSTQQITPSVSTIRDYVYGDALRRIHWPSTLRQSKLMVKEFDSDARGHTWIVLDMDHAVQTGKEIDNTEEKTVEVAASIASHLLNADVPVGVLAHGDQEYTVPPKRTSSAHTDIMSMLAIVTANGTKPLHQVLQENQSLLGMSSALVIITPSTETSWLEVIKTSLNEVSRIAIVFVDPYSFGLDGVLDINHILISSSQAPTYVVRKEGNLGEELDYRKSGSVDMSPTLEGYSES